MSSLVTRTFVKRSVAPEQVLEITWQGGEVEVVRGARGSAGRTTSRSFVTVDERDAYLRARVAKAAKEGFVEVTGEDAVEPAEPFVDAVERRALALRDRYQTITHFPRTREGDDARLASKYGGTPWLGAGDVWPLCAWCTNPMSFVVQLVKSETPVALHWAFGAELLQLFVCNAAGRPGDPSWICQGEGYADPFSPVAVVRDVDPSGPPIGMRDALPADIELLRQEPPPTRLDYYRAPGLLSPAVRIEAWTDRPEVPAYGDLGLDDVALLRERMGLECRWEDKLGGVPRWVQDPHRVSCRKCRGPMQLVLQLQSNGLVPTTFAGDGLAWLLSCPTCRDRAFVWQR